jgi:hypothetical protein
MPVRIKPEHQLDPCVLTLYNIQQIASLVSKEFPKVTFAAHDGYWEVYSEPKEGFLAAISGRSKLDSFRIDAESETGSERRKLEIVFNETLAKVIMSSPPEDLNWFEHFMIDLKKQCKSTPSHEFLIGFLGQPSDPLQPDFILTPIRWLFRIKQPIREPYCRIIIAAKSSDPFRENIKANLVSNIIWAVIVFVVGVIVTLVTQQFVTK